MATKRLLDLQKGEGGTVRAVEGGPGFMRRLQSMGIHIGDYIQVTERAPFGGPIAIRVHGAEFVIGRGIAAKILVESKP